MMKIAILGFGREGKSLFRFLKKDARFKNAEIYIADKNPAIKLPHGIQAQTGKNYLKNLDRFDIIFRSPGIPYLLPEIQKAKKEGVEISSATKLFFDECPSEIIGITGTKGKGTTATILYKILRAAGKKAFLAGNIGKPALDILPSLDKKSLAVLELSSFQLQDLEKSPPIAVILDVFPDHLDIHKSLKEYYGAKSNIARYQNPGDKTFFLKNNALSRKISGCGKGKKIGINSSTSLGAGKNTFKLFSPDYLRIRGLHNFKNVVMAATVAKSFGAPDKIIRKVAVNFEAGEHRLEFVRRLRSTSFYNDSASTNPQTIIAAIKSFSGEEKILIAGGQDKNLDYKPLAQALKNSETKAVILFGENKNKIARAISKRQATRDKKQGYKIILVKDLKTATDTAYKYAKQLVAGRMSHVTIIFSPGATSFDMFENYADRGEKFKKIVKALR